MFAEHQFVAEIRDADVTEIWCACGWMARTARDECFDYLDRHIGQMIRDGTTQDH